MMKRCVVLLGIFLPLVASAQKVPGKHQQDLLGKGHVHAGVSVGQGYKGSQSTTTVYSPKIQYFLASGWSVALEGRSLKSNSFYTFTYLGAGLSTRYYFLRGSRFALFAKIGATYGQSKYDKYDPVDPASSRNGIRTNSWQTNAGLGAHYRLGKRWSLEATAERSWLQSSYLTPDYNRWQANVGINYLLK
ncbi:outer membrane beta-barrel protein [Spirosoma pollinicola]|nr:outer membrane beta-barrel protein [Spirosoma pollinicola]